MVSSSPDSRRARIWSLGHSTHSLEELTALLRAFEIEAVADIRTVPKSRRSPHFHRDALATRLPDLGFTYRHLSRLGGWRREMGSSPNGAWRNRSFRGYADYAMSDEFAEGLGQLLATASDRRTAMMCSEALWWRCHRRIVADYLLVAGVMVLHIGSDGRAAEHQLTPFAEVDPEGRVTYPPGR